MFDFSFGELMLVGLVALVVLGPERLPKAARFVGLWVRRARAQWYSVKSELEHELASEELRRGLADGRQVMRETEAHLRATDAQMRSAVSDTIAEARAPADGDSAVARIPAATPAETPAQTPAEIAVELPAASSRQDTHGQ